MTRHRDLEQAGTRSWSWTVVIIAALFIAAAASSNWAIANLGKDNGPGAPHTIPIGWGLEAPSGVVLIGAMITLRDALHERIRLRGTLVVIVVAALVSATFAPASIAFASGLTLLVAETTDALVYQRLRRRGWLTAATASNAVSAVVDSALFLLLAFGFESARHGTWALTLGKVEASIATLAVLAFATRLFRGPGHPTAGVMTEDN